MRKQARFLLDANAPTYDIWIAAAQQSSDVPSSIKRLLNEHTPHEIVDESDVNQILAWASGLDGWNPDSPPLIWHPAGHPDQL